MSKREAILKELNLVSKRNGGMLRPSDVVDFAKDKKTTLHSCFTWDDTKAAEQWRLQEARMLIRVSVTVLSNDDETEYRAFVSLKEDRYGHMGYRPMVSILQDEELTAQMMAEALQEMAVFREKYKDLKELVAVFAEMDTVIERKRRPSHLPARTAELRA